MEILLATGNQHKLVALKRILSDYPVTLKSLADYPPMEEPEETGATFRENAFLKSRYYSEKTGAIAMADDSGLEVDYLNGEPGVYSARWAGADTPHSEKMKKLLELLDGVPEEKRAARFRCVAAITYPDGREEFAEGAMEGIIGYDLVGEGGFGYDPVVYLPQRKKTVAQLTPEEKDELSHRGIAFRALMDILCSKAKGD